jgi:transcriptional regulator of acetoin/glycerol metabolism
MKHGRLIFDRPSRPIAWRLLFVTLLNQYNCNNIVVWPPGAAPGRYIDDLRLRQAMLCQLRKISATDACVVARNLGKMCWRRPFGDSPRTGPLLPSTVGQFGRVDQHSIWSRKGAFTGATEKTPGKFREAEGGTIFLDEIGDMPLAAQVRLLRVLQQREVQPVGGKTAVPINVRVISASHQDLAARVQAGTFREDLYYRLNVVPLLLRHCGYAAMILLAQHFY